MTLQEILTRLDAEFPDRHVSFNIEVTSFKGNPHYDDPEDPRNLEMNLYDSEFKRIDCASLEDGIRALKSKIGTLVPEIDIAA